MGFFIIILTNLLFFYLCLQDDKFLKMGMIELGKVKNVRIYSKNYFKNKRDG